MTLMVGLILLAGALWVALAYWRDICPRPETADSWARWRRADRRADIACGAVSGLYLAIAAALALVALLVGCGGPELDPGGLPPGWCRSHFCMREAIAFAPAGEGISDELAPALARYRAATGRDDLGTDNQSGIPVVWQDDLPLDANGKENCGQTVTMGLPGGHMWTQAIRIDPHPSANCPSIQETLMHELIHALAPNQSHAQHGLFARASEHDWIDDEALSALCSEFRCAAFAPER